MKRRPIPARGAIRETYDLLHRAWRAGAITDFYYGNPANAPGVDPHLSTYDAPTVWDVARDECRQVFTVRDHAGVHACVERALAAANIATVEWGPRWCGYTPIVVTYVAQEAVDVMREAAA